MRGFDESSGQESADYQNLVRQYGLEPTPPSVVQLTQLIAQQDCPVDEIARVISQDASLRSRLLRLANRNARSESEYSIRTVEDALVRNGVGCALLMAMGAPLHLALARTFQRMLSLKLEAVDARSAPPLESEHVLGTIGFSGKAAGQVYLSLGIHAANWIAARILGVAPAEIAPGEVNDAIGELLSIIAGNFKSNLSDAGLDCRLRTPHVSRTVRFSVPRIAGGGLERMAFRAAHLQLFVDVAVNPWNEDRL